jgi:heme o synthase
MQTAIKESVWAEMKSSVTDFGLLVKFKLTLLVLFSTVMSYAIVGVGSISGAEILLLSIGGFLVTGAANALNQVLERDYDKIMARTANRPLAAGRMTVSTAVIWAGMMSVAGITFLSFFNALAGLLGALSLISYAFIYTPMKRVSLWSVFIGAIPGAIPLIIGCLVVENHISSTAIMLFMLQFLWQFPHFWAVAWLADEDYKKAGFIYFLPSKGGIKDGTTGLASMLFCLLMIVGALVAFFVGLIGFGAMIALNVLNTYWAWRCWLLFRQNTREAARAQMFVSFAHLPFSLLILLLDRLY